ncbi:MAG TPA: hypothetical protein VGF79_00415 [Bacteroidia bacterium]
MSVVPFLNFNGNCYKAMLFYQTCFGGELNVKFMEKFGVAGSDLSESAMPVVSASLKSPFLTLYGSDMLSELGVIEGTRVSLFVKFEVYEKMKEIVMKLSVPEKCEWNDLASGELITVNDQFGVQWMVICQ